MNGLILFVIVFFVYVVLDIAWTKYTQSITNNNKLKACVWAAIIPILSAILVLQYTSNNFAIIPMALGGAFGTWIAMTYID